MSFAQDPNKPKPADTTLQQDLMVAGQRRVNLIWEYTQAAVALMVVAANIAVWCVSILKDLPVVVPEASNALFLVIGFYFGRTNHERSGGIGHRKVSQERR